MHRNKIFLLITILTLYTQLITSQNNTNSPLTRFGFGDISDNASGEQRGMGGAAFGLRQKNRINTINPASYSSTDSLTFMLDFGSSAMLSMLTDGSQHKKAYNANLEYLTMQFRLFKGVGFSTGLLPYSFLGYSFHSNDSIQKPGTNEYTKYQTSFKGSGGFNQFYTGLSVDLFNRFSVGANLYYLFGSAENTRMVSFADPTGSFKDHAETNAIQANDFRLRYGIQYYDSFLEDHSVSLGLIYEPKTKLNAKAQQTHTNNIITPKDISDDFELPQTFGAGLHYTYNNKISFALDYSLQEWKNAKFFGKTDSLSNASRLALGFEYQPNYKGRKISDRMTYRAGIRLTDSYYKINSQKSPKNFGISFGVGLPLGSQSRTLLNMAFEYGRRNSSGSLKEDYYKLTFNFTLTESWFHKRKL